MRTTGVFSDITQAKAIATALTKEAKGGFEGFHNDAIVTHHPSSYGSWTVTVRGGCRAFHSYVAELFDSNATKTYTS